jgi:carboxypeptidase C (cathepsin A)
VKIRRFAAHGAALLLACAPLATALPAAAADPPPAATRHTVSVGGRAIAYTARAGMIALKNADGDETAHVFSVAYTADGADAHTRPVTFFWNGGPGSSTMWLHMSSYAPVRVAVPSNATAPPPGTPLAPNPDSLIDASDLVFIDAVGTGYSQITGKGTAKTFFGIDEDAQAFEQFIRTWITENDRWQSPKFLFGESYGTMRAAAVVDRLQRGGMAINGVVLLSSAIDYNALDNGQGPGEDYQFVSFLPTEAAVAWYHHKVAGNPPDLKRFVDEVRAFAIGPYADALMRGDQLDAATRRTIVAKLHDYTGLEAAYVDRADLRIDPSRFQQALQVDRGIATGRLDGRYQGPSLDRTLGVTTYDPTSDDLLTDAMVGAFSRYVREDLNYRVDRPYLGTNYAVVNAHWNFRRGRTPLAPNSAGDLREAMTKNPYLRVFAANGYYDLATPFFGTEYTLNHLGLDAALRPHIAWGFYPSGHMIYLNDEARRAFKADLLSFYRAAAAR